MGNCCKKQIYCTRDEIKKLTKQELNQLHDFVVIKIVPNISEMYKKDRLEILNTSAYYICGTDFCIEPQIINKLI